MNKSKEDRIKMLRETLNKIIEVGMLYKKSSPAWTLIQNSWAHVNSVVYLESENNFDQEILGVKNVTYKEKSLNQ